jgi:hypothetical protein
MHCELRNLPGSRQLRATPPIAIAAERIHVGKDPTSYDEIRLLAGLAQQIESYRNSLIFKSNKQVFCVRYRLRIRGRFRPSSDGFNERGCYGRGKLASWQKETKSGLLNPGTSLFQSESPKAVLAHPFGARLY